MKKSKESFSELVAEGGTTSHSTSAVSGNLNNPISINFQDEITEKKPDFKFDQPINPAITKYMFGAPALHQTDVSLKCYQSTSSSPYSRPEKPHLEIASNSNAETTSKIPQNISLANASQSSSSVLNQEQEDSRFNAMTEQKAKTIRDEFQKTQNRCSYTRQDSRYDAMTEQEAKNIQEEFQKTQNRCSYTRQDSHYDAMTEQEAKTIQEEFQKTQKKWKSTTQHSQKKCQKTQPFEYVNALTEEQAKQIQQKFKAPKPSRIAGSTLFNLPLTQSQSDNSEKEAKERQKSLQLAQMRQ